MFKYPSTVYVLHLLFLVQFSAVSQVTELYSEGPNSEYLDWELLNCSASAGTVQMEHNSGEVSVKKHARREVNASGWVLLMHRFSGTTCMCSWPVVSVEYDATTPQWYRSMAVSREFYYYEKQLTVVKITESPSYITYNGPTSLHSSYNSLSVPSAYLLDSSCVIDQKVYGEKVSRGKVSSGYTITYGPFKTNGTHLAVHLARDNQFMWGFQYANLNDGTVHYGGNSHGTAITFGDVTDTGGYATVELCFRDSFPDFTSDEITFFDIDISLSTGIQLPSVSKQAAQLQAARHGFYDLRGRHIPRNKERATARGVRIQQLETGGTMICPHLHPYSP